MAAEPPRRPAPLPVEGRSEAIAGLRLVLAGTGTAPKDRQPPAENPPIQVPSQLRPLLRGGEIQRGNVVAVHDRGPHSFDGGTNYLLLALAAGATAAGAWCAVVGMPSFGIAASAGLGARLDRIHMLDYPGERAPDAVAIMADAYDVVLWNPPQRLPAAADRRIRNRIRPADRQRGAALIVHAVSHSWWDADLHLRTADPEWTGLGQGSGHLTGRQVTVTASGRAAAGFEPSVRLWLPDATGAIQEAASPAQSTDVGQAARHLRPA